MVLRIITSIGYNYTNDCYTANSSASVGLTLINRHLTDGNFEVGLDFTIYYIDTKSNRSDGNDEGARGCNEVKPEI